MSSRLAIGSRDPEKWQPCRFSVEESVLPEPTWVAGVLWRGPGRWGTSSGGWGQPFEEPGRETITNKWLTCLRLRKEKKASLL